MTIKKRRPPSDPTDEAPRDSGEASTSSSCLVVGVGASAGGLQAFTELLENLPTDTGMTFVLVQHLDPEHESALTKLLARATKMPVREAADGMPVEPDHVYVIPPNFDLSIDQAVLKLLPREQSRSPHHSIDFFFESLGRDRREAAIGVLLSGAATDGTTGLGTIKAEGGITFAQDESARYDSMPRHAIAAGCVDLVMSPAKIAEELASIARHPLLALQPPELAKTFRSEPSTKNGFRTLLLKLRNRYGVDFGSYKVNTVRRRLARRMALCRVTTPEDYSDFIASHPSELESLYSDLLISVTAFFRNPGAFEVLRRQIFPDLLEQPGNESLRAWVVGCSTGQEAYSIAMTFAEVAEQHGTTRPLQIFASDVSDVLLDRARAGYYSEALVRDVPPEKLRRFFNKEAGGFRVTKSLRDMIVFARQNFLTDPPLSRMHLISCRNVLIYIKPETQQRALPTLHYALRPGGVLFIGEAESIGPVANFFDPLDRKYKLFSKKPGLVADLHLPRPSLGGFQQGRVMRTPHPGLHDDDDLRREASRVLLNRYGPASVLVSSGFKVMQFHGECSPFLRLPKGQPSFDLLRMAREGLMLPLRAAVEKARKDRVPVRRSTVHITEGDESRQASFEVIPLTHAEELCFLVVFDPTRREEPGVEAPERLPAGGAQDEDGEPRRVAQLEQELAETRDCLHSLQEQHEAANEELQSSNEEVTSANEELQSINEELETSKEELESTNEELTTVNDEMVRRNEELARANADLLNLHASVNMPIVLLTRGLEIRSFTPTAAKLFNLLQTDIGRPFNYVRHNLDISDLDGILVEVLDSLTEHESDIRDDRGRWWSLRARPYLTLDNKVDGVVIILVNIDSIKRSEMAIAAARDYAEIIVQTVQDPLLVLDRDLRIHAANTAFGRAFNVPAPELDGRLIYELDDRGWESPRLRRLLSRALTGDTVADLELALESPALGRRTMRVNAQALDLGAARPERILLVMHDVTLRKRLEASVAETVEAERQRFGRELHDGVAQELTGIGMLFTSLRNKLARMSSPLVAELDELDQMLAKANDSARKLAKGSFPVDLERGGLLVALQGLTRDTQDATGVSFAIESDDGPLTEASDTRAIQLFRIAQESIRNAIKHGGAKRIVVRLVTLGSPIVLTTTDDGSGLNEDRRESEGMGLKIMQYRAQMIGGELNVRNGDDGGVVVTCTIPDAD